MPSLWVASAGVAPRAMAASKTMSRVVDIRTVRSFITSRLQGRVCIPRGGPVGSRWTSARPRVGRGPRRGSRLRRPHHGRARRPDDFEVRLPTPRALQLQEHLPRLELVDDVTQPSVASKAAELVLCRWGHDQPSLERVLSGELRRVERPDSTLMRLSIGRGLRHAMTAGSGSGRPGGPRGAPRFRSAR